MDNERAVAEEGPDTVYCGSKFVGVGCGEGVGYDLAVLAREIAYLTGLWEGSVTGWCLKFDQYVLFGTWRTLHTSPRMKGSRWPSVPVQLPSAGTG